jgi:serine/threonine protein kinase
MVTPSGSDFIKSQDPSTHGQKHTNTSATDTPTEKKVEEVSRKRALITTESPTAQQTSTTRQIRPRTDESLPSDFVATKQLLGKKRAPESGQASHKLAKHNSLDVAEARAEQIQIRSRDIQHCFMSYLEFQTSFTLEEQNEYCLAIASELQDIIDSPKECGKDIYFKKGSPVTIETEEGPKPITLKWTFYINVSPDLGHAKIEINIPESPLGQGTYKRASKEATFEVPLQPHVETVLVEKARLRPNPGGKDVFQTAILSNKQQQVIKDIIDKSGRTAYMTEPAHVRVHQSGTKEERFEMIMALYCGDLEKVQNLSLDKKMQLLDDMLCTLDVFAQAGIVHRDIKPANVLLDSKHAYVHDFDLTQIESSVGLSADYIYWDRAGQLGLVSHASDVVGAVMTATLVVFNDSFNSKVNPNAGKITDFAHTMFKQGNDHAFQTIALPSLKHEYEKIWLKLATSEAQTSEQFLNHLKKMAENPNTPKDRREKYQKLYEEASYKIALLNTFCDVMKKEDDFSSQLVGSCICHFAKKTQRAYESSTLDELRVPYKQGVCEWVKAELGPTTVKKLQDRFKLDFSTLDHFSELPFEDYDTTYSFLNEKERKTLSRVLDAQDSLSSLIDKAQEEKLIPNTANNRLFAHLLSPDPDARAKGRAMCFDAFSTTGMLKDRISAISQTMKG